MENGETASSVTSFEKKRKKKGRKILSPGRKRSSRTKTKTPEDSYIGCVVGGEGS